MTESSATVHVIVEDGPEKGRNLTIPSAGARVGRSPSNDIALNDPSLSRFHCRFYFKSDGSLHLADLASTNETLVNDKPIQDVALHNGDRVTIGKTGMKVLCQTLTSGAEAASAPTRGGDIDLGLKPGEPAAPAPRRPFGRSLVHALLLALVLLVGFVILRIQRAPDAGRPVVVPGPRALDLDYEKVEASSSNLFYYALVFRDGTLSVRANNMRDGRFVSREKAVDSGRSDLLARAIEDAGFFRLSEEYVGRSEEFLESYDLTVTIGRRARRVRVVNRAEPDAFRQIRLLIEEFGRSELGLTALALPPERLQDMARDAWQAGLNFFNQREIRHDNLARAIRSFTEVDLYLETVEPKPAFYAEAVARRDEAVRLLDERYAELTFRADRAIRLRDWDEANRHLRVILDMLPDRDDKRYRDTDRKLLEVQSRMRRR